jgi:site-specific recombinase XerD
MTIQSITKPIPADMLRIAELVEDSLTSDNSKRAYSKAILGFLGWYVAQGKPGLNKAVAQRYRAVLQARHLSPSTINLSISAIRKLAQEAADNGLIDQAAASGIGKVKGVKSVGVRSGNWLVREQAQRLLLSPNTKTLKGLRDRAILAVMVGGGLRRSEVAGLTFDHIQQRDARWVIVDLVGKGNRVRTVPIPTWAKLAIDEWASAAGLSSGAVLRSIRKGGRRVGDSRITDQAIHDVVKDYGKRIGVDLAAHDLRRTYAKLARKGGSELTQIQLSLGHANVRTTQVYVGEDQDLTDAPCDHLGLKLA